MTTNDITRYDLGYDCLLERPDGDYVTYEDHVEAFAKVRESAVVSQWQLIDRLAEASPDLLAARQEFCRKVDAGEARSTKSYEQMKKAIAKATI